MTQQQKTTNLGLEALFTQAQKLLKHSDIVLAVGIIGIILVLLFPIPTVFLDILLAFSIATSVLILFNSLFISRPLDFSVFPTILLVTAIVRLSLNIASTRLILSNGHLGTSAAGQVIEAFGSFVMGGNLVIGIIVFIILTIINFIVITKGSGRIAEVAARFSLDAMPGKQMSIDADLSSGLIDEETAKTRRKQLEDESTFYGAMDGANKFVRGDAIAGILITFINFIAGIVIGVVQRGISFEDALHTYTNLTIGDGLVSQIPSIIISLAAGLIVSKSGVTGSTDKAIFGQLGKYPQALWLCTILTFLMAIMPSMPAMPFLFIGGATALMAWVGMQLQKEEDKDKIAGKSQVKSGKDTNISDRSDDEAKDEEISETLQLDSIRLELGYNLLSLINNDKGNRLTDQIKALRKQIAKDLGFVMPSVRIQDNMQLDNHDYLIKIKDIECGKGILKPDKLLIMDPKGGELQLQGEKTIEPTFGLPAMWIEEALKDEALYRGYTVVDPSTIITTHITEIVKENITELLSYSETQKLLDSMSDDHKKIINDLIPSVISISVLQKILQNLLSELVSIRDLSTILESISEIARNNSNTTIITEYVRARLARQISYANLLPEGYIPIVTLSQLWEQTFIENLVGNGDDKQLSLPPSKAQEFINKLNKTFEEQAVKGILPVLLVSPRIRPYVRAIIERFRPATVILSQNEIHAKVKIKTLAQI